MSLRILTAACAAALFAPLAHADKFYLGSADDAAKMAEDSSPNMISGVLLKEDDTFYTLRVEGGEMQLQKALVYKVEKDTLTVAAIEALENDAQARLAQADLERKQILAASDTEIAGNSSRAVEAAMRRGGVGTSEAALSEVEPAPVFDPVLGVFGLSDAAAQFELEALYRAQPSRELRRLMRMSRRLR